MIKYFNTLEELADSLDSNIRTIKPFYKQYIELLKSAGKDYLKAFQNSIKAKEFISYRINGLSGNNAFRKLNIIFNPSSDIEQKEKVTKPENETADESLWGDIIVFSFYMLLYFVPFVFVHNIHVNLYNLIVDLPNLLQNRTLLDIFLNNQLFYFFNAFFGIFYVLYFYFTIFKKKRKKNFFFISIVFVMLSIGIPNYYLYFIKKSNFDLSYVILGFVLTMEFIRFVMIFYYNNKYSDLNLNKRKNIAIVSDLLLCIGYVYLIYYHKNPILLFVDIYYLVLILIFLIKKIFYGNLYIIDMNTSDDNNLILLNEKIEKIYYSDVPDESKIIAIIKLTMNEKKKKQKQNIVLTILTAIVLNFAWFTLQETIFAPIIKWIGEINWF